ncbi:DUF1707 domain-containing protein [Solirubrobacter phytolaccae]|uniref:DUF1707 domain-containing protein n=1 Tax=Solirubrobacter phytolaccae TaxID=1404360 RepID=A0A9X3SEX4_9ACTN|nr:hypothetical protein [Solirubrobacter phytolaccae]MDA0185435.1 DUF1707 domain-containing protein [Solirubrobacter phytolaccae]
MPSPEQEHVAAVLGRHYAADRLDAAELDRRLDLTFGGALNEALEGLPPLAATEPRRRRWGRRHGEADVADPSWLPTKERFIDPGTQRVMRVWVDPADHARHYVQD